MNQKSAVVPAIVGGIFTVVGAVIGVVFAKPGSTQIINNGVETKVSLSEALDFYKSELKDIHLKYIEAKSEISRLQSANTCTESDINSLDSRLKAANSRLDACIAKLTTSDRSDLNVSKPEKHTYKTGLDASVFQFDKFNLRNMPDPVDGIEIGKLNYSLAPKLKFNALKDSDSLSKYFMEPYGILWSGFIDIDQPGNYVFSADVSVDGAQHGDAATCKTKLIIDDKSISELTYKFPNRGSETKNSIGKSELQIGMVPLKAWLVCSIRKITNSDYTWDNLGAISLVLSIKGPGDSSLKPIPANKFYSSGT